MATWCLLVRSPACTRSTTGDPRVLLRSLPTYRYDGGGEALGKGVSNLEVGSIWDVLVRGFLVENEIYGDRERGQEGRKR